MAEENELCSEVQYIKACDQLIEEYRKKLLEIEEKIEEVKVTRVKELIRNQARLDAGNICVEIWEECKKRIVDEENEQLKGLNYEYECNTKELDAVLKMRAQRGVVEDGLVNCTFIHKIKQRNNELILRKKLLEKTAQFIKGYYDSVKIKLVDEIRYTNCICERKAHDEFLRFSVYEEYISFRMYDDHIEVVISAHKAVPYDKIIVIDNKCEALSGGCVDINLLNRYMFQAFEAYGIL